MTGIYDFVGVRERQRVQYVMEFCARPYHDVFNQSNDEYLDLMGQRLSWFTQDNNNLHRLNDLSVGRLINTDPPPIPTGVVGGGPAFLGTQNQAKKPVPRGGWIHQGPRVRVACMPTGPLGSLAPCTTSCFAEE
jgi:hypothetical protein